MAHQEMTTYQIKAYRGPEVPDNYINFILSKWMRSFRYGNEYIKLSDSDAYYRAYERYLRSVLESPLTTVRLAVLTEDPDVALGFSAVTGETLHYVYVGIDYRGQGIGTKLVPLDIKEFTHLTKKGMAIWSTRAPTAVFNPWK